MFYSSRLGNNFAPPAAAWQKQYDYDAGGNCIYEGWGVPGKQTSDAAWVVVKRTFASTAAGANMLSEQFAGGAAAAVNVWNNRGALTYE